MERFERKKCLNDAGLHVEGSRAVGFITGDTEGHFLEGSGGINRVVVPQDKQLPGSMRFRTVSHAEVVAAMLLRETFDVEALFLPLLGDYPRAAVGGSFRKAGRFRGHEPA